MTPRRSDDDSPLNGSVWKGFPIWLRAGLIFGPLGVVFVLVCGAGFQIWNDIREGQKSLTEVQKQSLQSIAESMKKQTEIADDQALRDAEFKSQVRSEHSAMQRVVEATSETSQQTVKLMTDAKEMMRDAPKQRQDMVEQGQEHTSILVEIRDELKRNKSVPPNTAIN